MSREIFGIGPGGYAICDDVLTEHMRDGYLLVRDPKTNHEFVCVPSYGTWTALTPYDMLYRLKWMKEEIERLRRQPASEVQGTST